MFEIRTPSCRNTLSDQAGGASGATCLGGSMRIDEYIIHPLAPLFRANISTPNQYRDGSTDQNQAIFVYIMLI